MDLLRVFPASDYNGDMVLVVPGNPGVIDFYADFIQELSLRANCKVSIFGSGHLSHSKNFLVEPPRLWRLEEQIEYHMSVLRRLLASHVRVVLIGHSIGSYIILEILQRLSQPEVQQIHFVIHLFPTIEHMALTPRGRIVTPILRYLPLWLVAGFVWFLQWLPRAVLRFLIRVFVLGFTVPESSLDAVEKLFHPVAIQNHLSMAYQEMLEVKRRNNEAILRFGDRQIFYYSPTDHWTLPRFYSDLKVVLDTAKSRALVKVCEKGFRHAFVLSQSSEVAAMCSQWISSILGYDNSAISTGEESARLR